MASETIPMVCVVGAGTAGLEGLLAARETLGERVELTLIAPEREFRYRPISRQSPFAPARERGLELCDVVERARARWIVDRAQAVHEDERAILTRDGDTVAFDYVLVAVGSAPGRPLTQGELWARGADPSMLDRIIHELLAGELERVAVNIPRGARWPLPAYELALVLAWRAASSSANVTLITAESQPLAALGAEATDAVLRELDAAGVEVLAGVEAVDEPEQPARPAVAELEQFERPVHAIELGLVPSEPAAGGDPLFGTRSAPARVRVDTASVREFDRLISLPTVVAPFIAGLATDPAGFIEVGPDLRVCGSERVWAAGGCIAAALQHSALSARQADAAISGIASALARARGDVSTPPAGDPAAPDLIGILLTDQRARWLAENPPGIRQPSTRVLWWPPGRAVGRMLARQIAAWDPDVHEALPSTPGGVFVRAPIALGCGGTGTTDVEVGSDVRTARLRDIENRQLLAVQRREREADAELRALEARLDELGSRQHHVIGELQRRGYLQARERGS